MNPCAFTVLVVVGDALKHVIKALISWNAGFTLEAAYIVSKAP